MKASQSPYNKLDIIPTGYPALDKILGRGGIPTRKITEISGPWSVGKSTMAMTIVGNAQSMGMPTLWVDTEFSWDEEYAKALGVDNDEMDLIQERFAEGFLDEAEKWISETKNGLIVLDSVGGLLPRVEAEKTAEQLTMGTRARLMSTFVRKIVPLLNINNLAFIALNHEFMDIRSGALKTAGGEKLAYHKSIWVRLKKKGERIMQGENQIGEVITAEIRKNKVAGTKMQKCDLQLMYGEGFSKQADVMTDAIEKGVITKKGNTYMFDGEKVAVGMKALREAFKSDTFTAKVNEAMKL